MRPTEIGLKSPVNKTPFPSHPLVSQTGDSVLMCKSKSGHSFTSQKRFDHYRQEALKSGFRVGPGCYDLSNSSIGIARVNKTHYYKDNSYAKGRLQDGFYYAGNHLVYDNKLIPKSKVNPEIVHRKNQSYAMVSKSAHSLVKNKDSYKSKSGSRDILKAETRIRGVKKLSWIDVNN